MERNYDAEYRQLMIDQASYDRRVQGSLEWLILGRTELVSDNFLNDVDHEDILRDVGEHYGLAEHEAKLAFEICEQRILDTSHNG